MPQRATRTSFKPGQSGNPRGRPPHKSFRAIYREKLTTERRERIAERFIKEAENGSLQHLQAILSQLGEPIEPAANVNILAILAGRPDGRELAQRVFAAVALGAGNAGGLGMVREPEWRSDEAGMDTLASLDADQ